MTGQLRAELLKQRSTPTTLFLFLAMFGLVALAVALHVLALGASNLSTRSDQLSVFEVGTKVGMIFAGLVGAMAITAEIRHGTIRPTFLVTPRRGPVLAAKLAVGALAGIVFGLLAEGLMAGATTAALSARGIDNQLATLVGLCAWMLLVENLLLPFVPDVGRFTPGAAGLALAGSIADKLLTPTPAALMLALYAAAAAAGGWLATLRRDVARARPPPNLPPAPLAHTDPG